MVQEKLRADLKRLAKSPLVGNISRQWTSYGSRVKRIVRDFDLKSREAREKSRKRLDQFTQQLQKTRGNVEKKVSTLLNTESSRLNKRVNDLFNYLKSMANSEKLSVKAQTSPKKKKTSKARSSEISTTKRSTRSKRIKSDPSPTTH